MQLLIVVAFGFNWFIVSSFLLAETHGTRYSVRSIWNWVMQIQPSTKYQLLSTQYCEFCLSTQALE